MNGILQHAESLAGPWCDVEDSRNSEVFFHERKTITVSTIPSLGSIAWIPNGGADRSVRILKVEPSLIGCVTDGASLGKFWLCNWNLGFFLEKSLKTAKFRD